MQKDVLGLDVPVSDVFVIKKAGCRDDVPEKGNGIRLGDGALALDSFLEGAMFGGYYFSHRSMKM